MAAPAITLGDIVAALGGELIGADVLGGSGGAASHVIDAIEPLEQAGPQSISFLSNPRYRSQLDSSAAGCVIVGEAMRETAAARGAAIVTPDPYLYFARLTQWWARRVRPAAAAGVHPSAVVDASAQVAPDAHVGALAVVEAGAVIDAGAVVAAQCFVGRGARVGAGSLLHPRAVLSFGCSIGARCIVHSGAVIGADGFGLAPTRDGYVKIEQLGAVRIGDDVEIGANTCIDRGALGDTVLEDGVKLDNLVQIGHNVHVGRMTAMAGCAAVAGSTRIGARCTLGGGAGVAGHLTLADDVHISARSAVTHSIFKPGTYTGFFPLDENRSWEKNAATLRQLHALRGRVRELERQARPAGTGGTSATSGTAPNLSASTDPGEP